MASKRLLAMSVEEAIGMRMKARDGNLYAEVTLRDVVERCDVSDTPILAEVKRLYEDNDQLRMLVYDMKHHICQMHADDPCDAVCDAYDSGLRTCSYELRMRELGIEA